MRRVVTLLVVVGCVTTAAWAVEPSACALSPLPATGSSNMFNAEAEMALGDNLGALVEDRMESIAVPELTGYLEQIGDRLVRHLPTTGLKYRFFLSDLPQNNAMSIVGGRIYVTRKLVANARTEDELAGVIGHELGHIVTHQQAITYTDFFKQVGIPSVSGRKDVDEKFQRYLELRRKVRYWGKGMENDQRVADNVGMEAVVRAGYAPEGLADFFDRIAENKKKKGSWFSDLVGSTPPEARRYREMLKLVPKLPSGCVDTRPADAAQQFRAWQKKVVEYRGSGRSESLHSVMVKRRYEPPLQDDVKSLRFSPDGNHLIAQNSGTVYVLHRQPLEVLFQFEASNAYLAQFTPDSKQVLIYDHAMRIERWDIATQQRVDIDEVAVRMGCRQLSLSPDGSVIACLDGQSTLAIIDVESGDHIVEQKEFNSLHFGRMQRLDEAVMRSFISVVNMAFSPDGRYFVAEGSEKPFVYDVKARAPVAVGNEVKELLKKDFTFVGPAVLAGVAGARGERSRVVRFPSGETVAEVNTGAASVDAPGHGNYLMLRPVEGFAVGVLDIAKNKVIRANKKRAFDVYDGVFASEMGSGEVALFQDSATPIATLKLPRGRLGRLESASVSPDMRWVAMSGRGHSGVWSVGSGQRLYDLKGFQSAYFAPDGGLYVDFPKQGASARSIVRLGLEQHSMTLAQTVSDEEVTQHGAYLTILHPLETPKIPVQIARMKEEEQAHPTDEPAEAHYLDVLHQFRRKVQLEVKDAISGAQLWSHRFDKEMPFIDFNPGAGTAVFRWRSGEEGARDAVRNLVEKVRLSGGDLDQLLEVVDTKTGTVKGRLLIRTNEGTFRILHATAVGDTVIVRDTLDRLMLYSLSTGQLIGRMFGNLVASSADGRRICVQHESGRIVVYDTAKLTPVDEFSFATSVRVARFGGSQLFVLTADQTAYVLQVKEAEAAKGGQ